MTNKYRGFFLNIIYLVLLVEVALNKNNINYEEYVNTYQAIKGNNIKIKKEIEDIEKKNLEYFQKINEKNIDFIHCLKIKTIIEETKSFCTSINKTKENLILENGGYDEKNNIKNLKRKVTKEKTLEEISGFLMRSYQNPTQLNNNNKNQIEENKNPKSTQNKEEKVKTQKTMWNIKRKRRPLEKPKKEEILPEENVNKNTDIFKGKSVIELLTALEQKENEFLVECLIEVYKIEKKIEENKWDVSSFDILIKPEKNIIKQNEQYKAQVYLVAKNTNEKITVDGKDIKDNIIVVQPEQNSAFDSKGLCKKNLDVKYSSKSPFNNKTVSFSKTVEFYTSNRKDVEGKHAIIDALYKNCDNLYSVRNLDPERNTDISFSFEGGTCNIIKRENDMFTLVIIPKEDKGVLHILNSKKELDKIKFNVREIGKPKIEVIINNKIAMENSTVTAENINDILLISTANENFKDKFPNESYYEVQNFTIYFCKEDKAFLTKEINGNSYRLSAEEKKIIKKAEKLIIKTGFIKRFFIDPETKKEKIKENNILSGGEVFSRTFTLISKEKEDEEE